jgi:16S rRNA (guanine966-N2)-methyltransferase
MRVIAGEAHGRRLKAPRGLKTRPTSARARESIFSRLAVRLDFDNVRVLDIFAGSGSLGIESLSRGAASVVFVDSSREAASAMRSNLGALGLAGRARIMIIDVNRALAELAAGREQFDLIFVDAPYKNDISAAILDALDKLDLIAAGGWIVIEQSRRAPGPPLAPNAIEQINAPILGDHRIAFYRRPESAPSSG